MTWKEIKSWAKDKGYKTDRSKIAGTDNSYSYSWHKIDDENINGTSTSVSKLAFAIYNNMTDNQYVEYQEEYLIKLSQTDIDHDTGFGFQ